MYDTLNERKKIQMYLTVPINVLRGFPWSHDHLYLELKFILCIAIVIESTNFFNSSVVNYNDGMSQLTVSLTSVSINLEIAYRHNIRSSGLRSHVQYCAKHRTVNFE